jgi:hypothetical protein
MEVAQVPAMTCACSPKACARRSAARTPVSRPLNCWSATTSHRWRWWLRVPAKPDEDGPGAAFGLLVLGSPDARRFHEGMGTAYLAQIGEVAGAALNRLRD